MTGAAFARALHGNDPLLGTLVATGSPQTFDVVADLGLDFVFIDTEHITYNQETVAWMCRAYRAAGLAPVVRLLSPDPYLASKAIDWGADAVLAPYVEEIEDVIALVGAVKYKPLKGRKLSGLLAGEPAPPALSEYLAERAASRALLLNIESPRGVRDLEKMLAVPGVDGIVIGPHDLSVSHEMPEAYGSADYEALVADIIRRARACNAAAGCHTGFPGSLEHQIEWAKYGANIVLHAADIIFFREKATSDFDAIRRELGLKQPVSRTQHSKERWDSI